MSQPQPWELNIVVTTRWISPSKETVNQLVVPMWASGVVDHSFCGPQVNPLNMYRIDSNDPDLLGTCQGNLVPLLKPEELALTCSSV
jgi:hypothetical protein